MNIDMEEVRERMYIPFSQAFKIKDYYLNGNGAGYRNGNGNEFYQLNVFISEYSPSYNVNCLYN